jgi:AAA ATPase domain
MPPEHAGATASAGWQPAVACGMATLAPSPRVRGREVELAALGATLDRAASGRLAVVIVDGEAGIGKTRLLAQALQEADGRGFQVAAGRAHELERTRRSGCLPTPWAAPGRRRTRAAPPSPGCWPPVPASGAR